MFPISIEGQIQVQGNLNRDVTAERLYRSIRDKLKEAKANDIRHEAGKLTFRAGMFRFVPSWNMLVAVDSGEFKVIPGRPGSVKYRFSMVQLLAVTTIMSCLLGLVGLARDGIFGAGYTIVFWLWLFGANYVIALIRLRSFVRNAVSI
jgi:hypothetical protein